jgi:hypothetical protein
MVRLNLHFVLNLNDRHFGMFAEEINHQTFMSWIEMLDQDKGHACV